MCSDPRKLEGDWGSGQNLIHEPNALNGNNQAGGPIEDQIPHVCWSPHRSRGQVFQPTAWRGVAFSGPAAKQERQKRRSSSLRRVAPR
jgi:hypothetical protein